MKQRASQIKFGTLFVLDDIFVTNYPSEMEMPVNQLC